MVDQMVAVATTAGRRKWPRRTVMSRRRKAVQSRTKTASGTNGFSRAPTGGRAMPANTSAVIARVPCRPSQARAAMGAWRVDARKNSMDVPPPDGFFATDAIVARVSVGHRSG